MVRAGESAGKASCAQLFSPAMPADQISTSSFTRIDGSRSRGLLILADHATNHVPPEYGDLGLQAEAFRRHIAYDIGTETLTRRLADLSGAPALLTRFSRLVIDPNRGEDDPTLVMRLSDGAIVPGNAAVDAVEREQRILRFHRPYHDAIACELDAIEAAGRVPVILSIHSFTPAWKSVPRPWPVAILWDRDPRLARPLIRALEADGLEPVGDNQPYDGALKNDTLYRHGTRRGFPHALVEVRQDLVADEAAAGAWAERLWRLTEPLLAVPELHEVRFFGSRSDGTVEVAAAATG